MELHALTPCFIYVCVGVCVGGECGGGLMVGEVNGGTAVFPVSLATQWGFGVKKALNLTHPKPPSPLPYLIFSF